MNKNSICIKHVAYFGLDVQNDALFAGSKLPCTMMPLIYGLKIWYFSMVTFFALPND